MNAITREEAIDYLIENNIFDEEDINDHEEGAEFYIKHFIEGWDVSDIDRMANLNTLFGYDIGANNAIEIDIWFWDTTENDITDEYPMGLDSLELGYKDKELVRHCVEKLGLNISFDKWRTKEIEHYEYY